MTKTEIKMTIKMLDDLLDQLGNNGCNDYYIANTPENREFTANVLNRKVITDNIDNKEIFLFDTDIAQYCRKCLKRDLNKKE